MANNAWSKFILLLWVISVLTVVFFSLIPKVEVTVDIWNADKAVHFIAYVWLAILPVLGIASRRQAIIASLSMIALGVTLEIGQYFLPGRSFSVADMIANSLGAGLGIYLGKRLKGRSGK